ncbi:MAG: zinc finger, C3HC4 type (RING finger) domain containing protein [Hyperionvirus sp.]|uniref:Zinc finger, C3HC4 type (RING finger) domain containing protein n=1 Tax=Hyperionvirus sp. TaxID=2487770 RepID=A0A3G5AD36_9VIRU|nr:MAG: zinc finger, C3HC4 type (RING finger) domain containing protein [Hyperionvirus sp.]
MAQDEVQSLLTVAIEIKHQHDKSGIKSPLLEGVTASYSGGVKSIQGTTQSGGAPKNMQVSSTTRIAASVPLYVIGENPEQVISRSSIDAEFIFGQIVDNDFLCSICGRVPLHSVSPICCGKISCRECLGRWVREKGSTAKCPHCREPCATPGSIVDAVFVATKISALLVKCPHADCTEKLSIGKDGKDIIEHLTKCANALIPCTDCKKSLKRLLYEDHKPSSSLCPMMPMPCDICNCSVPRIEWDSHIESSSHNSASMTKFMSFFKDIALLQVTLDKVKADTITNRAELKAISQTISQLPDDLTTKLAGTTAKFDIKLKEQFLAMDEKICEFEISKWSEIKDSALFNTGNPFQAWGHEWSLKVEKEGTRIGLYLCCAEDGRFPFTVDYQLMLRKRNEDVGVCASVLYRTDFGSEKAWGLSKFTTTEIMEREGAYSRTEDKVTFGCRIIPVKGLRWGIKT